MKGKMMLKRIMLLIIWVMIVNGVQSQSDGVSDERFERLSRGINLTGWFWYGPQDHAGLDARFTDAELMQLVELGFTYVRIPITLEFVLDPTTEDLLNQSNVDYLLRAIQRLNQIGLAVTVDIHSTSLADSDAANYSGALEDPAFVDVFVEFWGNFAAYLSDTNPEMVFLEPMNEPVFYDDPQQWVPIQEQLIAAIRENAPEHTIVVSGARWSSRETLMALEPFDDRNLVYNFHWYEPFVFTHQGATWSSDFLVNLRDIPYPSSPQIIAPLLNSIPEGEARDQVRWYGEGNWNAERIRAEIDQVAAWAAEHNLRLICNEFGVHRPNAPIADRAQWTEDVRTAFEANNIGWAMWDYDNNFGLVTRDANNRPLLNSLLARALGLNLPQSNSLQTIIQDMTLPHEGRPHGVPSNFDWALQPRIGMGNNPGDFRAFIAWGQVYEAAEGNPATNTRVQLRDIQAYYLSQRDQQWHLLQRSYLVDGAAYREDFAGDDNHPADMRLEADGSVSVKAGNGYNFHFWAASGRVAITPDDIAGIFVTVQARLILDDPALPDDRANARYLLSVGADYWLDETVGWQNWETNADVAIGRFRYVTPDWQSFNMTTLTATELSANPPPF
ncbi:MAG: hypothetical protein D6711_02750 [Chloroflexi bacterium]|nr:MAG: hypothetical protein D6711_02750 [Chloroflexota bacterium]